MTAMKQSKLFFALYCVTALLTGCGAPQQPAGNSAGSGAADVPAPQLPADQKAVTVVATGESAFAPATLAPSREISTVEISQPSASNSQCPRVAAPAIPAAPAAFADSAQALLTLLNAGATIDTAGAALQAWGVKIEAKNGSEALGGVEYAKVLAGDDQQLVVTLFNPVLGESVSRSGDLVVYTCVGGAYQIAYQASTDPAFEGFVSDPRVLTVDDVTGDGIFDLSFLTGDCGAATCMDGIAILSSHGNQPLRNLSPDFAFVPFPTFEFAPVASGARDLIVAEGILGDPGAGPQRSLTTTWSFNGAVFTQTALLRETASYRIHALQDADDALRDKDYREADSLLGRVINDPSLQSWDNNPNLASEPQILGAFAYVRLIQSSAARGDVVGAQAAFESLQRFGPADSPGYLYTQMGEVFYNAWKTSNDMAAGCAAAIAFAQANPTSTQWLGSESFGSANYDYQPEDMCLQ